jgi:hypothetical protein
MPAHAFIVYRKQLSNPELRSRHLLFHILQVENPLDLRVLPLLLGSTHLDKDSEELPSRSHRVVTGHI